MADLTNRDKNILESYLQMEDGHLLGFTHKSLGRFFEDYDIDIYDEAYTVGQKSGSKANKMRGFWTISDNQTVGSVLLGLIQRYDDDRESNNHCSGESGYSEQARLKCIDIANKLIPEDSSKASKVKSLTDAQASALDLTALQVQPCAIAEMTKQLAQPSALAEMTKAMEMSNALTQQNAIDLTALTAHMQPHSSILDREFLTEQIRPQPQIIERPIHYKTTEPYMNTPNTQQAPKQKVFIVHGHDDALRLNVENFIRKIGLDPIILMDQASAGDTIIEKLENHGEADYAIVLYTACDFGKGKNDDDLKARARQNVVFEHGYFIARLTRKKVAAIVESGVEIPNDTSGIVYIGGDEGWKMNLARELNKAGLIFNSEAVFS